MRDPQADRGFLDNDVVLVRHHVLPELEVRTFDEPDAFFAGFVDGAAANEYLPMGWLSHGAALFKGIGKSIGRIKEATWRL